MQLTEEEIKRFIYYGTYKGKYICNLTINNGENIPHLDWVLITAFNELDKNTIWNGNQVEEMLFKRIYNLVKLVNDSK